MVRSKRNKRNHTMQPWDSIQDNEEQWHKVKEKRKMESNHKQQA